MDGPSKPPTGDTPPTPGATGHSPPTQPRDADTNTVPGTGTGDQAHVPTTQISTPAPSAVADPKEVLKRAQAQDVPQPGEGKAKHYGKAGPGVQETGKDTGIEPGKNVGLQTVSAEAHALAMNEIDRTRTVTRNSRKRLDEKILQRMSPAEIRAVAVDRQYEVSPGGRRATIRDFVREQDKDDTLEDDKKEDKDEGEE